MYYQSTLHRADITLISASLALTLVNFAFRRIVLRNQALALTSQESKRKLKNTEMRYAKSADV